MKKYYINTGFENYICAKEYNPSGDKNIVLIHGWPLNQSMFDHMLYPLIENNYRVVTMDLRGFGESDCGDTNSGNYYQKSALDILSVTRQLNIGQFCLLGFSMGGAICSTLIDICDSKEIYPVQKLILLNAAIPSFCKTEENPYGWENDAVDKLIEIGKNDQYELNKQFGDIFLFNKKHPETILSWFERMSESANIYGEIEALKALQDNDVFKTMQYIDCPTLIIHGKEDEICKPEMASIMHENISESELKLIDGAGHGSFIDKPDEIIDNILEFLQK